MTNDQRPTSLLSVRGICIYTLLLAVCGLAGGCATAGSTTIASESLRRKGLVIILPGIEGKSSLNEHIRQGLVAAGVDCAIEIHQWGLLVPVIKLFANQVNVPGNYSAGRQIAKVIATYQDRYPDNSVYLIGHSGGGGIAVFALEALEKMPGNHRITGAVLLSPSISASYNLSVALKHTRLGIANFYNESDVALLGLGTTILGNVDGWRGAAAGRASFDRPGLDDTPEKVFAYSKLYQVKITREMTSSRLAHMGTTGVAFIATYVAEWVTHSNWPPPGQPALSLGTPQEQRPPAKVAKAAKQRDWLADDEPAPAKGAAAPSTDWWTEGEPQPAKSTGFWDWLLGTKAPSHPSEADAQKWADGASR
jgi:pimeloyl-ACP methyl ester carboxylesterase